MIFLSCNWKPAISEFTDKSTSAERRYRDSENHGFNYIRLRIFNDPLPATVATAKKGFCDLAYTKQWPNAPKPG
jgi:arabinogalactan endo-1,4-beta-galactosidase